MLSRKPAPNETDRVLLGQYNAAKAYYDKHSEDAAAFTTVGQLGSPDQKMASDVAATMLLANLLLNLDEGMTHE